MSDAPKPTPKESLKDLQKQGQQIWSGLSLGGKILLAAGAVGALASFLPYYSASGSIAGKAISSSSNALEAWQGVVGLLAFIAAALGVVLLMKQSANRRNLLYGTLGAAGLALLMAIWIFAQTGSSVSMAGLSAGRAFGGYLHLLAGLACAAGAGLMAKEDKLF